MSRTSIQNFGSGTALVEYTHGVGATHRDDIEIEAAYISTRGINDEPTIMTLDARHVSAEVLREWRSGIADELLAEAEADDEARYEAMVDAREAA